MKIELDEKDILEEIRNYHRNDAGFILEIIDAGTTSWEPYKEIVKYMLSELKRNGELNIDELLPE